MGYVKDMEMWELGNMVYLAVATTYKMPKSKVGEVLEIIGINNAHCCFIRFNCTKWMCLQKKLLGRMLGRLKLKVEKILALSAAWRLSSSLTVRAILVGRLLRRFTCLLAGLLMVILFSN